MNAEDLTWEGMRQGVKDSEFFVLFLTNSMLSRNYCLYEISWAIEFKKPIVAVVESDSRFWAWDYGRWERDECARDRVSVQVRFSELVQSDDKWPHADRIKTKINDLAADAVLYCRRKFEAAAMVREIVRRGSTIISSPGAQLVPAWGDHLPPPVDEQLVRLAASGVTTNVLVVAADTDGAAVAELRASLASLGGVTCVPNVEAADRRAVVVLSGALLADEFTLTPLDDIAAQNAQSGTRWQVVFLYKVCASCGVSWDKCTHGGWQFSMASSDGMKADHSALKELIGSHEALPLRTTDDDKAYAHRAMVVEVLRRLKLPQPLSVTASAGSSNAATH